MEDLDFLHPTLVSGGGWEGGLHIDCLEHFEFEKVGRRDYSML